MIGRALAAALLLAAAGADADEHPAPAPADVEAQARAHFTAGSGLYELKRYSEAIREFAAAYDLTHHAALLLDLGTAYRKLGDLRGAREMYRSFLEKSDPADPYRAQAKQILSDLDAGPALPSAPPPTRAVPPPSAAAGAAVSVPAPRRSFARRHWWIFPVVALAAAGIAVGIYFGVRGPGQPPCDSTTFGCINP